MIWELFLGMFLILGSAWILVNIVELFRKLFIISFKFIKVINSDSFMMNLIMLQTS